MVLFSYVGPEDSRELWGCVFPRNEPIAVVDSDLAAKCRALGCFEEIKQQQKPINPAEVLPKKEPQKPKRVPFVPGRPGREKNTQRYDDVPGETRIDVEMAKRSNRTDLIDLATKRGMRGVGNKRKADIIKMLVDRYGKLN